MNEIRKVKFLDLSISDQEEINSMKTVLKRCLDHGQLVMGREINILEGALAEYVGRRKCISVSSGTDAVYLALRAIDIGKGDEVITTPLSWIATTNAISMLGAEPVFCDIKDDLNIDPASIEKLITTKTKAILTVDYTGNMANYDEINKLAKNYGLKLVEDGSQSFGASFSGIKCGGHGLISAVSHNPMKIFGALGECGSIFTDDELIAEKVEILRYNGMVNKEYLKYPSLNFRADALQAAFLVEKLKFLPQKLKRRQEIADRYTKSLKNYCETPTKTPNSERVFYTYTIKVDKRDELSNYLIQKGIENKIQHPLLMSEQEPYKRCVSFTPNATKIVKRILCLPIHESLHDEEIDYVIDIVKNFLK